LAKRMFVFSVAKLLNDSYSVARLLKDSNLKQADAQEMKLIKSLPPLVWGGGGGGGGHHAGVGW
jgi:hypothetical protein